jgi:antibiotic biosynthesis monooxygenase (ABM) superfamily enzyme
MLATFKGGSPMATMFVRHKVKDFKAWKKTYDEFDTTRRGLGVTGDGVYQAEGNPNDVTVYHEFATLDAAKAFASSSELKNTMEKAGVVGAPDIWFTKKA